MPRNASRKSSIFSLSVLRTIIQQKHHTTFFPVCIAQNLYCFLLIFRKRKGILITGWKSEIEALRSVTPEIPVTANLMRLFNGLDYRKLAKEIAAALLDGETVGYFSDYPISQPEGTGYEADVVHRLNVWVTCRRQEAPGIFLRLIPKKLVLGIGCRRGTPGDVIETAVRETLEEHHLDIRGVSGAASIDLKKDEAGLLETAAGLGIPFSTYSSEELAAVQGDFSESGFVRQVTGVGNVCERSALCCAGTGGRLIVKKQVHSGVTVAVAEKTGGE